MQMFDGDMEVFRSGGLILIWRSCSGQLSRPPKEQKRFRCRFLGLLVVGWQGKTEEVWFDGEECRKMKEYSSLYRLWMIEEKAIGVHPQTPRLSNYSNQSIFIHLHIHLQGLSADFVISAVQICTLRRSPCGFSYHAIEARKWAPLHLSIYDWSTSYLSSMLKAWHDSLAS